MSEITISTGHPDAGRIYAKALERVTAERDAALETLKASREVGVSDQQTIQNLVSDLDTLQQRLTAADELLTDAVALLECVTDTGELTREPHSELEAEICAVVKRFWSRERAALKPAEGHDEPNCLLCLDKKTVPSNLAEGYVMDCPDCCGEEG